MTIFQIFYLTLSINFTCLLLFIYVLLILYLSGKSNWYNLKLHHILKLYRNDPSSNFSIFFEILLGADNQVVITSALLVSSQFVLYRSVLLNFLLFGIIHSIFWRYWDAEKDKKIRFRLFQYFFLTGRVAHQQMLLCADILALSMTDLPLLLMITFLLFSIFGLYNSPMSPIVALKQFYLETYYLIFNSKKFLIHIAEVLGESIFR